MVDAAMVLESQGQVPKRVLRALRAVSAHPAVVKVIAEFNPADSVTLASVEIAVNLPASFKARGQSDNGVRAVEPVRFAFDKNFPVTAPYVALRPDFDRGHPHLQPRGPNYLPEPCLVLGSVEDLMRSRGMPGVVDQLVDWLDQAAIVKLIDPNVGWEPIRRDRIDDTAVADLKWLSSLQRKEVGWAIFETAFLCEREGASTEYVVRIRDQRRSLKELGGSKPSTVRGQSHQGRSIAIVSWAGKLPGGTPFVADRYLPDDVVDVASLLHRSTEFGATGLPAALDLLQQQVAGQKLTRSMPVIVVLLARRPIEVMGSGSSIEPCAYLIELNGSEDLSPTSKLPVRLVGLREEISVDLLRRASGDAADISRRPWTLVGCGSLGSKLAVHLARAGRGPTSVIDKSMMGPHNYARHALLPGSTVDAIDLDPKAHALARALAPLGQPSKAEYLNVVGTLCDHTGPLGWIDEGTFVIVNATASISVREALCKADHLNRTPRIVETSLFAAGSVGLMSVEGPARNPSSNDLAAEAFRIFAEDARMMAPVFGAESQRLVIGQGCSSVTFPMSDAKLSSLAAPMAEELTRLHDSGLPVAGGEVIIGTRNDDGLGQSWARHSVGPWIAAPHAGGPAPYVRISPRVDSDIGREVALKPGRETGGILIGRFSDVTDTFHIVDLLPAPRDSRFSAAEFVLGIEGLKAALAEIIDRSGGSLYPLGTWHNHLVSSGPSSKDVRTALYLADTQAFPVLMLIRTPDAYRYLTAEIGADGPEWVDGQDAGERT